jgi:choline dehydrogenase-like flavoprotein
MEFQDFRRTSEQLFETDLCIVGTGPAGVALAQEFIGSSLRVLLVESGDLSETPTTSALNQIESVGAPRQLDQALVRTRVFGGTSHVWSGRCATLDAIDFEERAWLPYSGWPIDRQALMPYFHRAADNLGLGRVDYDDKLDARLEALASGTAPDPELLKLFCWQFSVDDADASSAWRCARSFGAREAKNVRVLLNATATHINTDLNGTRLDTLEVSSLGGKRALIRPRVLVLCAGGLEIPRLLLASNRIVPHGVGNRHDLVGRFLMDHPRCTLGHFELETSLPIQKGLAFHRISEAGRTRVFLRGLALSAALQRKEGLLNCAAWARDHTAPDDPWTALKRLARLEGKLSANLRAIASQPRLAARQLHRRLIEHKHVIPKIDRLELVCDVEQAPDPASRLTLSNRSDALGVPVARVDWRIGDMEKATLQRFGQVSVQAFQRMGLPAPILTDSIRSGQFAASDFIDVAHPSGAARMSSNPRTGVVDANCQVHEVDRLYAVGSAVFPTNGHANPTLTIVALAIRLADLLKSRHFDHEPVKVAPRRQVEHV